ncbi:MAG: hypothetical protein GC192_15250 [Bacteroidetes bacterium]|nr:hypothetical protein [Bacteroidota bacterium]
MNAIHLAIIQMLQTLKAVVNANLAKYTVIPAFTATFTEVTDLLTEMENLQTMAVRKTNDDTKNVLKIKTDLAKATVAVAIPMKALANKLKDLLLLGQMKVNVSGLKGKGPIVLQATCKNIFDKATELKTEALPYNLTQAKLDKLDELLTLYKSKSTDVGKLQGEINTSKRDIDQLQDEAMEILRGQLDPMVSTLLDSDFTAVELWKAARHIKNPISTTTQLLVTVSTEEGEAMLPMTDVPFFAVNGKTYSTQTNALGEAQFKPLPYGLYDLRCEVPGYMPYLLKGYKVVRGRVNKVEVKLLKAA